MARLPALVDALTQVDGRERVVIDNVARAVREGGWIQTTKRGRGAAEMTAGDAAALVVGLYGAGGMVEAPGAVERFGQLRRRRDLAFDGVVPAHLGPLWRSRTVLDATANLIELGPWIDGTDRIEEVGRGAHDRFRVALTLNRPTPFARVRVSWWTAAGRPVSLELQFVGRADRRLPAYDVATTVNGPVFLTLHRATAPSE